MDEDNVNSYLLRNCDKYESTFKKEITRINSKRKVPRNYDKNTRILKPLKTFNDVLNYLTHEEKAALISSIESSHHRISIMSFYIDRQTSRKRQGANTWNNKIDSKTF